MPDSSHNDALSPARQVLARVFGYDDFRFTQEAIIGQITAGGDALVLMPTGGGKSLCYQIPALLREGLGVVISPLIALMQDQVSALQQLGVRAEFLNSSMSQEEASRVEQAVRDGELDLLYVAPERLMLERTLGLLSRSRLALFAIDEAHCVSQWGHDFRPEYIRLSILHERFPEVPRIALTATADEVTRREIVERLALQQAQQFVSGFDRPNICYRISENQGNARERLLRFLHNEHPGDAGIVYCLSRKKVDETARWLTQKGLTALPYHAGLPPEERRLNQARFLREDGVIIVATIAFGMGIDKPDVRFVAHLNLPKSLEAYYQETGRAGRDGQPANAWMVYGLQDVIMLRQMQAGSVAHENHKRVERHKLDSMLGFCELTRCRRQALLEYFDDHSLTQPCGNCDTCLTPPETWDATVAAQKALSCIHRTGQRFGVNYLVDILLGKDTDRIRDFGHDKLTTFGIGKELDQQAWRNLYRQLIAHGLLSVDLEGYGGLHLTEACRPVLRGEQQLMLRKLPAGKGRGGAAARDRKASQFAGEADKALWQALRAKRQQLAAEQSVPAYVIFHDATLMEMVTYRPETREQLGRLNGVGERKLEAYAEDFLAVIAEHLGAENAPATDTVEESLQLFRVGMDAEQIARQRDLTVSTVMNHLARAIEQGQADVREVTGLDEEALNAIRFVLEHSDDSSKLKPVFEALNGEHDYAVLRCVKASMDQG
ncbi:DNA helicase RecQ [Sulfuriflexus sp.]|uniref:DNA helicase RecQ n=1 Tax=Sulfuriflexus sp. TaxID=2015443 RepID=UPI0028CC30D8|nr:DNA helicase RecQ [Sulfuriflexus sp.]MDT8405264.1 DNA helicase RecQ [Sulfuriflexus sp.]